MSFDLCQVQQAERPFYIEAIGIYIYSIEELCYYLHENLYLIDQSLLNQKLFDWLRDELGLKKLAKNLQDLMEKEESIASLILPIFRETGYLTAAGMREYAEQLARLDVQAEDMREKMKADYLVRSGMYESAEAQYRKIIRKQTPGSLSSAFFAGVWNNLGCVQARMFRFEEAAESFRRAWELTPTRETLRKYVSVLPLYLTQEEYEEKLKQLEEDQDVIRKIQEHNLQVCEKAREAGAAQSEQDPLEELKRLKRDYRRSARI